MIIMYNAHAVFEFFVRGGGVQAVNQMQTIRKCYLPVYNTMRLIDYDSDYTVLQVSNSDIIPL